MMYAALAAIAAHVGTKTPFFLVCPPVPLLLSWLQGIARRPNSTTAEQFEFVARFLFFLLVILPVINTLWIIDEILFWRYRSTKLDDSVFVVAGFRTGSTNLHRAFSLDEERFVSPRMIELLFPLLSVQYILDGLEWVDSKYGTSMILYFEELLFEKGFGKELTSRHPMSWYGAEEDDILLALWLRAGWYAGVFFGDRQAWMDSGRIEDMSAGDQSRVYEFYARTMQKVLYRRGDGRILLSKSHLMNLMPLLQKNIPGAKFVGIVRHPKDTFVSWYSLAQAGLERIGKMRNPQDVAVGAHLEFWDEFTKAEMDFFKNANTSTEIKNQLDGKMSQETSEMNEKEDRNRTIMSFSEYLKNQRGVVEQCYKNWGYGDLSSAMTQRLKSAEEKHTTYKKAHDYFNPKLGDLGLDANTISKRYSEYIKTYGL